MNAEFHPLVKRLLDGEVRLEDLPVELRAEGERALRLLAAVDLAPVSLSGELEARVMAAVRRHARSPARRTWRWINQPRDIRVRVRPWMLVPTLAAAATLFLLVGRGRVEPSGPPVAATPAPADSVSVRFVLYAPAAHQVAVAGSFNQWDPAAAPLVRSGTNGVWTATLTLPVGQHQYTFVVDGTSWLPDPSAPAVDDGFGRRNSVVAVTPQGARSL